jgi:hypothetical protein
VLLTAYYRTVDDFLHHADMLSGFLPHPQDLLKYVVVACFRKILFRVNHRISKPYLNFLEETAKSASSSTFPRFQIITLEKDLSYKKGSRSDTKLFTMILPRLLPVLQRDSTYKFPRLEQAIQQLKCDDEIDPIKAYNEVTYIEYHLLLQELLRLFEKSLIGLENLENTQWHSTQFDHIVWYVTTWGDALRAMAGGNIIKMHIKVLTAVREWPRDIDIPVNDEILDDDCQRDHELYQIINTFPKSQAFHKWLKLIVVHFDAVRILITYMETFNRPKEGCYDSQSRQHTALMEGITWQRKILREGAFGSPHRQNDH